ncbi:proline--tRNA ligase [Natronoglycomyces albus]|uniref:Proline--tRNA ligase n=1 Tax=Natronoglycomyces albus TaxID=2811108 RepID=A0A895XKH5_9ACTN|nr:proline--tRNA ligase [Natronoglycomyces albus]QSB04063.1 proline--tRNA ligase [Natronoglycomyces albus]
MKWSNLYAPTLREDPAEADAASHRLLVRAGYIRQLQAGHYSLLPLAVRVRTKVMAIVREELDRIGAQEFLTPVMHPAALWQQSGRWDVMGPNLFRLKDRKGAEQALGVTHEEVFTSLGTELRSYKQLPQIWYQFQTKLRDEARPKAGLMRVREFTMKDSYSFDVDEAGLDTAFDAHKRAYHRIFERLGIPVLAADASNGSMSGSGSTEFACPAAAGEDIVMSCPACKYAANTEKATSQLEPIADEPTTDKATAFDTPNVRTINDLVQRFDVPAVQQIKTLVYFLDGELTLVLMRGDHGLVDQKLLDSTGAIDMRPADDAEIVDAMGAHAGSLGAVDVDKYPIIADSSLAGRTNMVTGANRDGQHLRGVDMERDITVSQWADLREVTQGEPCPTCATPLDAVRAIEVGHIFKLGRKYTDAFGVTVLDVNGKEVTPIMGSYGIGVERAIAAAVEVHHDDKGIVWPLSIAPYSVAVVILGKDESVAAVGEDLYERLSNDGIEVLLDDRNERPGAKFADAELVGIPYRVTVSKRGIDSGTAEITNRANGETEVVELSKLAEVIKSAVD